jgi:hypothetical protein
MNRLITYNTPPSIATGRYDRHLFGLQWKDDRRLYVKKHDLDSGQSLTARFFRSLRIQNGRLI